MAKRVMTAEANTDAPKPLRGTPDGTGYRDMARLESTVCTGSDGRVSADGGIDRKKIGIIPATIAKAKKGKAKL